ncbi:MAG: alginate O-acetyltransferase AlgX-related protein [Faecalimonas umbilicata]
MLKEKLPAFAATEDQNAQLKRTEEIVSAAGIQWIDAAKTLNQHKNEEIYYRTDHHWTTKRGILCISGGGRRPGDFAGGDDSICTAYGHRRV